MRRARRLDISCAIAKFVNAMSFNAAAKDRDGNLDMSRLVHSLEYAVTLQRNNKFGNVLLPQLRGKYPVRLFLQVEIVVAPTGTENCERDFVDVLGVNVGLLLHSLSVCSNEDTIGIWVTGWAYWEVGLSSDGVPMAVLNRCVIETCNLATSISNLVRQGESQRREQGS